MMQPEDVGKIEKHVKSILFLLVRVTSEMIEKERRIDVSLVKYDQVVFLRRRAEREPDG